jgi:hypothetical protein
MAVTAKQAPFHIRQRLLMQLAAAAAVPHLVTRQTIRLELALLEVVLEFTQVASQQILMVELQADWEFLVKETTVALPVEKIQMMEQMLPIHIKDPVRKIGIKFEIPQVEVAPEAKELLVAVERHRLNLQQI